MLENKSYLRQQVLMILLLLLFSAGSAFAQTTSFTYQGRLTDSGTPANGTYDLQLTLWDALSGGTQQPQPAPVTVTRTSVLVTAGIFTVQLDFGASAFPGADRFLEIGVRPAGGGAFTILSPRQPISSTPYAIRSLNATKADAVIVSGVPGGSGNYIQNATTPQASANFNISGNGTAAGTLSSNIVNATTQYNIGGFRILSTPGIDGTNLFAGFEAGAANMGSDNEFFGYLAGRQNTAGKENALFGAFAGGANLTGSDNSFFGFLAGADNTTGGANSFFGPFAGLQNTTGSSNTAIGSGTRLGSETILSDPALTNATAIGASAEVTQSNSLVLGSIAGVNFATASVNVGIGTTTPQNTLHVKGGVLVETSGSGGNIQFGTPNSETGMTIVKGTSSRADLRFDGAILKLVVNAGNPVGIPPPTNGIVITTAGNVGIGTTGPDQNLSVNGNASKMGGGSWLSFSDERLKDIKGRFTPGLAAVLRLQPLHYQYKTDNALGLTAKGDFVGFSAQAVQKVIPEAVITNDKGYLLVNNDPILWTMLNAIKEQQNQIETLRTQNAALNARLRGVEKSLKKKAGPARRRH